MVFDTILLSLGSDREYTDRLIDETIELAQSTGATVVVLHVFTESGYENSIDTLDFDTERETVTPDTVARRLAVVREVTSRLDDAGVDHEIRGGLGETSEEICATAEEVSADRVIVGGRNRSPTGKAVFGSTAQEVMLSCPCPVTFVRAEEA